MSMKIPLYLSLTAAEFRICPELPTHSAWMACHFSPYGTGLTNLPRKLPEGALLILNDRTPIQCHDPKQVCDTLLTVAEQFQCRGILLDLQRPDCPQAAAIAAEAAKLPCPVIVSELYAKYLSCPVFLPPPPLQKPIRQYLSPWQGREIWLEAALDSAVITVTRSGSTCLPHPYEAQTHFPFSDDDLHCRYRMVTAEDRVCFTLQRSREDVNALLEEAEAFGVAGAVGLWQELG